jgi:hypothetical protein
MAYGAYPMVKDEILWRLECALETLAPMRGQIEGDLTDEATFATGIAMGNLVAAINLVKRDIVNESRSTNEPQSTRD